MEKLQRPQRTNTAKWMYEVLLSAYAGTREDDADPKTWTTPALLASRNPVQGSKVVEELFKEWNVLKEDNIKGVTSQDPLPRDLDNKSKVRDQQGAPPTKDRGQDISYFSDAISGNFLVLIEKAKTWEDPLFNLFCFYSSYKICLACQFKGSSLQSVEELIE